MGVTIALLARPAAAAPGARITDNLYGARFVSADDGWAVGGFGTVYRTRDGGVSWRQQATHTIEHLYGVDFADAQHGWVVGRSGTILHTDNGGDTWEAQKAGSEQHLFSVKAIDPQHAWAIGDFGTILATHDGGQQWENHTMTRDIILNGQAWLDTTHGWIVGEGGTIVATSDGGATWTDQTSDVTKTLFGVCFVDAQNGWAAGLDGLILHTQDGGQTWQAQHGEKEVGALEQVGFAEALGNPSLYDVAVSGKYGYAVGDVGGVFVSEDGGATWQRKELPSAFGLRWIRAASLANGAHGVLVGANGLTIRVAGGQVQLPAAEPGAADTAN
jgi:photosystem II stability/assembly factor-like uncharacterized protein